MNLKEGEGVSALAFCIKMGRKLCSTYVPLGAEKGICALGGAHNRQPTGLSSRRAGTRATCAQSAAWKGDRLSLSPLKSLSCSTNMKMRRTNVHRIFMAQRKGFEPLYTFLHNTISNRARSAAPPSLQSSIIVHDCAEKSNRFYTIFRGNFADLVEVGILRSLRSLRMSATHSIFNFQFLIPPRGSFGRTLG